MGDYASRIHVGNSSNWAASSPFFQCPYCGGRGHALIPVHRYDSHEVEEIAGEPCRYCVGGRTSNGYIAVVRRRRSRPFEPREIMAAGEIGAEFGWVCDECGSYGYEWSSDPPSSGRVMAEKERFDSSGGQCPYCQFFAIKADAETARYRHQETAGDDSGRLWRQSSVDGRQDAVRAFLAALAACRRLAWHELTLIELSNGYQAPTFADDLNAYSRHDNR